MSTPTNHWKLGLFVVVGLVLLLGTIGVLGARSLRKEGVPAVSFFDESVQGLDVGSPVKFRGVTIGAVSKIGVAPDRRHVVVTSDFSVEQLQALGLERMVQGAGVPEGSEELRVQLASMGLTGVKFLQIDFFSRVDNPRPELPFPVPPNTIHTVPSTLKSLEDSLMRTANRIPEIADQLSRLLERTDNMVAAMEGPLPARMLETLESTNALLRETQAKVGALKTRELSAQAERTLGDLDRTVARVDRILTTVDAKNGLLQSITRASDAFGTTVGNAENVGAELESTMETIQEAARSIKKLSDALERDPDMLLKGRAEVRR